MALCTAVSSPRGAPCNTGVGLTYNGPTAIDIHDFVNNNDFNIPIGEEYELDRMLPYVANETDDGMSVTVYFERVETNDE